MSKTIAGLQTELDSSDPGCFIVESSDLRSLEEGLDMLIHADRRFYLVKLSDLRPFDRQPYGDQRSSRKRYLVKSSDVHLFNGPFPMVAISARETIPNKKFDRFPFDRKNFMIRDSDSHINPVESSGRFDFDRRIVFVEGSASEVNLVESSDLRPFDRALYVAKASELDSSFFQTYQKKLFILPRIPDELKCIPNINTVFGHKKVISMLEKEKIFGVLMLNAVPYSTDQQPNGQPDQLNEHSCGPIFIPWVDPEQIYLLKFINQLNDETSARMIDSIGDQLSLFEKFLNDNGKNNEKKINSTRLHINIFLIFSHKTKKKETDCQSIFSTLINWGLRTFKKSLIKPWFVYCSQTSNNNLQVFVEKKGKRSAEPFQTFIDRQRTRTETDKFSVTGSLRWNMKSVSPKFDSGKTFRVFKGEEVHISDYSVLNKFLEKIFPKNGQKVHLVPRWDQIKDHPLFETSEEGRYTQGSERYLGEVSLFRETLYEELSESRLEDSFLIKGWNQHHYYELFPQSPQLKIQFEFDWLCISKSRLIIIEIGTSQSSESVFSSFRNKLFQVAEVIKPSISFVLYAIYRSCVAEKLLPEGKTFEGSFDDLLAKVTTLIFLPGLREKDLESFVERLKPEDIERIGTLQTNFAFLNEKTNKVRNLTYKCVEITKSTKLVRTFEYFKTFSFLFESQNIRLPHNLNYFFSLAKKYFIMSFSVLITSFATQAILMLMKGTSKTTRNGYLSMVGT